MRTLSAMLLVLVLFMPSVQAQPLPPGKPAGVKEAALDSKTGMVLIVTAGVAVITAALGIVLSNAQSSSGT